MENNIITYVNSIILNTTTELYNKMNDPIDMSVKTYEIEGNIDFYSAIYEDGTKNNIEKQDQEQDTPENICLITGDPLVQHYQILQCGHKFNYIPLYLYVKQSKYKFNYLEHIPLKVTQIKCPYCRNVQNELLPYIEDFDFPKIPGVNHLDEQYHSFNGRCEYVNSKKLQCMSTRVYLLNERCYCYTHRNIIIHREHKQSQLYKLKMSNKVQKKSMNENVIISESEPNNTVDKENDTDTTASKLHGLVVEPSESSSASVAPLEKEITTKSLCTYIFIKGIYKGCLCNRKISNINEIYCKQHKKINM